MDWRRRDDIQLLSLSQPWRSPVTVCESAVCTVKSRYPFTVGFRYLLFIGSPASDKSARNAIFKNTTFIPARRAPLIKAEIVGIIARISEISTRPVRTCPRSNRSRSACRRLQLQFGPVLLVPEPVVRQRTHHWQPEQNPSTNCTDPWPDGGLQAPRHAPAPPHRRSRLSTCYYMGDVRSPKVQ